MDRNQSAQKAGIEPNAYRQMQNRLRPALVTVLGFSAVINLLMLTGSIYMLQVYDRVLSSGSVPTLLALFGIVVVLFGFLAFYDFLRARMLSRASLKIDHDLGAGLFQRWLASGLPDEGQDAEAQPLRDLETVRGFVSSTAITALCDLPFVPLFLAVLFIIHPWLGMMTVAGACVAAAIALTNRALTRRAIGEAALLDNAVREFAERGRRNGEAVIAMGMAGTVTDRWRALQDASLASAQSGSDPSEALAATSRTFRMLLQSAMLTLGAVLVLAGQISAGMIIASSILSGRALAPVDSIIGNWRAIGRAAAAHKRLDAAFADARPDVQRIELADPTGQITVRGLTKLGQPRASGERPRILAGVNFALQPGDGMGVIGNSASGKSTLARCLVGAAAVDAGEIRLDGATPDQWDPARLGRKIGYLPQIMEIIPGTIRDNICRFDPEAEDVDVIAAARLTGVHEMILGLPDGYATGLGQPGQPSPLSGGQLQRLGLARAVYGMPPIVVLDEPNSNLDVAGDEALTRTIAALRKAGSVVIVMAHRPSALAALDKLMILDAGTVKLFGNKDEVLGQSGGTKSQPHPAQAPGSAGQTRKTQSPPAPKSPASEPAAAQATRPAPKPVVLGRAPAPRPDKAMGISIKSPAQTTPSAAANSARRRA